MSVIKPFRIKKFKLKDQVAQIKDVSLSFGNTLILDKINIELNSGEIVGLLGPNGAGKSTIFNLLTGLIRPDSGNIIIEDKKVNEEPVYIRAKKYRIGYVPQHGGFFYDLTLLENLQAVGEILIKNKNERQNKINNLILKFELDNSQNTKAKFLSGGQKRKLVICMALMYNPKILLCDEIFAALDVLTIQMLCKLLIDLQRENSKMCILICEHQARELLSIVDRALILSNGKIIAEGSPNQILNDKNARSKYFGSFTR